MKLFVRCLRWLAIIAVALYLLLFATGYFAASYLVKHYSQQPLAELDLELGEQARVRYNLFTSTLFIEDLSLVDANQNEVASIKRAEFVFQLRELISKRIYLSEVRVDGGHMNIAHMGGSLHIAGVSLGENQQTESANSEALEPSDYQLVVDNLALANFVVETMFDEHSNRLRLDRLTLNDLALDANQQTLSIDVKSTLDGSKFNFTADAEFKHRQGEAEVWLDLAELNLENYAHFLEGVDFALAGEVSLRTSPNIVVSESGLELTFPSLSLDVQQMSVNYAPWLYRADKHRIYLSSAALGYEFGSGSVSLRSSGFAESLGGQLALEDETNTLVAWDSLELDPEINIGAENRHIIIEAFETTGVEISKVGVGEQSQSIARLSKLEALEIALNDEGVSVDTVLLYKSEANVKVLADKRLAYLIDTSALDTNPADDAEGLDEDSKLADRSEPQPASLSQEQTGQNVFAFKIAQTRLVEPFELWVQDASIAPAYQQQMTIHQFELGLVDSSTPLRATPIALKVSTEDYFSLDLAGDFTPLANELNASMKGNLTELNLSALSPYLKNSLGFEIKSGQLDMLLELQIEQNELAGDARLTMRGLEMTKLKDFEKNTIRQGQAIPLNVALGMLKDGRGNIALKVPIKGDISDPSFNLVRGILTIVVKKAAMNQAKNYLLQTFVPYANVVSVALSGADYLLKVRLEPLAFSTGQVAFDSEQTTYLNELAQLMADKKKLQIKTCAISTLSDLGLGSESELSAEQRVTLVDMGAQRQSALKRFLVDQAGIESSRILACSTEIDKNDGALPRIKLQTD